MKNRTFARTSLAALVTLLIVTLTVLPVLAATAIPKHETYIADDAQLLSEATVRNIAKNNEELLKSNGTVIGVCTIKSTGDEAIADYARRVYTDWKMGEGVLIVVASEDENYYLLQSTGIEDTVTNASLETLRDEYMENDFAAANIDRAVYSVATKLMTTLSAIETALSAEDTTEAEENTGTDGETEEEKGTTVGGFIVGLLKFILIAALILIAAFVIFFVIAMFNDDAAELMQKYVFQRGKSNPSNADFYDERLYGTNRQIQQQGRRNAQNQQRMNPQQNRNYNQGYQQNYNQNYNQGYNRNYNQGYSQNQNQGYNRGYQQGYANQNAQYPQNTQAVQPYNRQQNPNRPYNGTQQRQVMYNADGTPRRQRPVQQNPAQNPAQNMQNAQMRTRQTRYEPADDDATRMFSLPLDSNHN
ncbi:MAG: TPM domain-containing protein [Clostridia bacterium]|nr:TPM domain-containing protein [Clostridia bacterium]